MQSGKAAVENSRGLRLWSGRINQAYLFPLEWSFQEGIEKRGEEGEGSEVLVPDERSMYHAVERRGGL